MPDSHAPDFDLSDVTIRPAEVGDHKVVRDLYESGILEGQIHDGDTGADIENLKEGYFSDDGASGFWLACHSNEVIGMIGVQATGDHSADLRRLRVHDTHRRQGVGTLLVEHAIMFCREHDYLKISLDVRKERGPATMMVEKFGFSLARTRKIGSHKIADFYLDLYSEPGT